VQGPGTGLFNTGAVFVGAVVTVGATVAGTVVGAGVGAVVTFGAIVVGTVVDAVTQLLFTFAITEATVVVVTTVVDTTDFGVVFGVIVVFGVGVGFVGYTGRLFIMSSLFFVRAGVVQVSVSSVIESALAVARPSEVSVSTFGVVFGVIVGFGASVGFIGMFAFGLSAKFFVRAAALSEESPDPPQETKAIATTARREHF